MQYVVVDQRKMRGHQVSLHSKEEIDEHPEAFTGMLVFEANTPLTPDDFWTWEAVAAHQHNDAAQMIINAKHEEALKAQEAINELCSVHWLADEILQLEAKLNELRKQRNAALQMILLLENKPNTEKTPDNKCSRCRCASCGNRY